MDTTDQEHVNLELLIDMPHTEKSSNKMVIEATVYHPEYPSNNETCTRSNLHIFPPQLSNTNSNHDEPKSCDQLPDTYSVSQAGASTMLVRYGDEGSRSITPSQIRTSEHQERDVCIEGSNDNYNNVSTASTQPKIGRQTIGEAFACASKKQLVKLQDRFSPETNPLLSSTCKTSRLPPHPSCRCDDVCRLPSVNNPFLVPLSFCSNSCGADNACECCRKETILDTCDLLCMCLPINCVTTGRNEVFDATCSEHFQPDLANVETNLSPLRLPSGKCSPCYRTGIEKDCSRCKCVLLESDQTHLNDDEYIKIKWSCSLPALPFHSDCLLLKESSSDSLRNESKTDELLAPLSGLTPYKPYNEAGGERIDDNVKSTTVQPKTEKVNEVNSLNPITTQIQVAEKIGDDKMGNIALATPLFNVVSSGLFFEIKGSRNIMIYDDLKLDKTKQMLRDINKEIAKSDIIISSINNCEESTVSDKRFGKTRRVASETTLVRNQLPYIQNICYLSPRPAHGGKESSTSFAVKACSKQNSCSPIITAQGTHRPIITAQGTHRPIITAQGTHRLAIILTTKIIECQKCKDCNKSLFSNDTHIVHCTHGAKWRRFLKYGEETDV